MAGYISKSPNTGERAVRMRKVRAGQDEDLTNERLMW